MRDDITLCMYYLRVAYVDATSLGRGGWLLHEGAS